MIDQVRIENLGVIAAAELDLDPALTVITGETGAGKTMVLTSLALLLGGKADAALVRRGAERAVVEGTFTVPDDGPAAARAEDAGAAVEDGELLVARTVPAAGRSRAHLGGRTVPTGLLTEIGEQLVTVHGQADQLRLRAPSQQRAALDAFGGPDHAALLGAYREAHGAFVAASEGLAEWEREAGAREHEIALLRAGLEQVDALEPQPGEDHALREEALRLGNVEELRLAAGRAHQALTGDVDAPESVDATTLLDAARRSLEQAADNDAALEGWAGRLAEASYLLSDVAAELAAYLDSLDADPVRLEAVHARRAALAELTRAHGPDVDAVLAWAEQARARLDYLDGPEDTAEKLRERLAAAQEAVTRAGAALTASRHAVAERLAAAVDAELAGLAMAGAHLTARLTALEEPGPHGLEGVELLLAPHPGAPARPLGQGASGGELSRVMLAIEVALAGASPADGELRTFVFDEVDAGVGGKAAVEVGRRLARLARGAQVIVVTHLAQVAAFADRHLVVRKNTPGDDAVVTATDVTSVEGPDRVRELARMLSGQEDSETALRHAAELLERADVQR
ncbi:DNA repair protein RecN [Georgenia ruanii]|uniref:DNA repair protein RecN n=1 Tax=Georgenia ruanii TaxID=348442 RepID=A0A7J9UZD5_9MICO|nr:DNA repair protein RecN [Georgenia ruanii]MPV90005.1 DNA repair protein RecN [Georgenia ruanii]